MIKYLNPKKMLRLKKDKPVATVSLDNTPYKKKEFGQHFLRNSSIVDRMIDKVRIDETSTVIEIGCGDGFLTDAILKQTPCKQLISFEIDKDWADFVREKIKDKRLNIQLADILQVDWKSELSTKQPTVMLANLPYQVTFPILFKLQENKSMFNEGVIMVQEEVAQKITAKRGKKYSPTTMFLQHHFEWELLNKVEPGSFDPAPKVFSRTIYFKPKFNLPEIPNEQEFWKFVKLCFRAPRQTIKNNLKGTKYSQCENISINILQLRSQQLSFDAFCDLWKHLSV